MNITKEQIERSVETGKLQLDPAERRSYFWSGHWHIASYPFFIILILLLSGLFGLLPEIAILPTFVIAGIIAVLMIVTVMFLKGANLRLIRVSTPLSEDRIRELVVGFSSRYQWKVSNNRKSLIVLKTGPGRSGSDGWGERIAIFTHDREAWISSICDPDRRTALRSFRRNQDNIYKLRQVLSGTRLALKKKKAE